MLRTSKDLEECVIGATGGTIGHVKDLYFDGEAWVMRPRLHQPTHRERTPRGVAWMSACGDLTWLALSGR